MIRFVFGSKIGGRKRYEVFLILGGKISRVLWLDVKEKRVGFRLGNGEDSNVLNLDRKYFKCEERGVFFWLKYLWDIYKEMFNW